MSSSDIKSEIGKLNFFFKSSISFTPRTCKYEKRMSRFLFWNLFSLWSCRDHFFSNFGILPLWRYHEQSLDCSKDGENLREISSFNRTKISALQSGIERVHIWQTRHSQIFPKFLSCLEQQEVEKRPRLSVFYIFFYFLAKFALTWEHEEMAKKLDGEIVSCDSIQVYKGISIGSNIGMSCFYENFTIIRNIKDEIFYYNSVEPYLLERRIKISSNLKIATKRELDGVPLHMTQLVSLGTHMNVADYTSRARDVIRDILSRKKGLEDYFSFFMRVSNVYQSISHLFFVICCY